MRAIAFLACSVCCVLGQQLDVVRNHNERESLRGSANRHSPFSSPIAGNIIPSRQTSAKVTFRDDDNRDDSVNQINSRFQEQRLQEHAPQPYDFGYSIQDEYGNSQYRQETGDQGGVVRGSYGYTDALGIYRKVKYIADGAGYRAEVSSNEPGMKGESPASASFIIDEATQTVQPGRFPSASASASFSPPSPDVPRRQFPPRRRLPSASVTSAVSNAAAAASAAAAS